ncbi:type VII secretion integral membrane protein EccD [Gordonia sinesedis]
MSVLGGNTQLDVALPAVVPVAALIPDLVTAIEARVPSRRDPDDPDADPDRDADGRPHDRQHRWTLALVGQEAIAPHRSLTDAGIRDGDLLVLRSTRTGEAPVLFDDVVDAVARLNESQFANWSAAAARHLGYAVALLAATAAALCLGATRYDGEALWPAGLSGLAALSVLTAATVVARHYRDATTATVLSMASMPLVFVSGMLITPGGYGAAHLTLGFALVLLAAVLSYRVTAVGAAAHAATVTIGLLGGLSCLAALLIHAPIPHVAAVTAAVGLLVIGLAPRMTIMLAKLPVPPVPTAGAPIDAQDIEPSPAIEGIGAIGAMALPKADALERRSALANAYLTGIVAGTTAVTAVAAFVAAAPLGGFVWKPFVYAVIVAAVLCLRGRSHSDLYQASALVIGGSITLLALVAALATDGGAWPLTGFIAALVIMVGALVIGVIAATHEFSPVLRRAAELGEYILVALIVPLLLWILDLYRIVREI